MKGPNRQSRLEKVLQLVEQLSQEEVLELRDQLNAKTISWESANLRDPTQRAALYRLEDAKAGERVRLAFEKLQSQGIVDRNGYLVGERLPADMEPGSDSDVGG